jgi:hypothetical protein
MPRSGPFRLLVFQPPVLYYAAPSIHTDLIMTPKPSRWGSLTLALILFIPFLHAPAAFAGDDGARPRVQRLTLFKNGLGFIVSGITLPDNARTVRVEITKELSGEVLETLPHAGDVKSARGLRQVNTKHILTWTIGLDPGEEQNVSYQYQVYFRD